VKTGLDGASNTQELLIGFGIVALLVAVGAAPAVGRSITRPLGALQTRLEDIADGEGD
jgi:methyl-accepting chemotaxis protein